IIAGTFINSSGNLSIAAGLMTISGTYQHNRDGGTIPAPSGLIVWNPASTVNVTGITITNPTVNFSSAAGNYGNFIWNCPNQVVANANGLIFSANSTFIGDFTVTSGTINLSTFIMDVRGASGTNPGNVVNNGTINANTGEIRM